MILEHALQKTFAGVPVTSERAALTTERDVYSPRVDIAVGPFAIDTTHETDYDQLVCTHTHFLAQLHVSFVQNVQSLDAADMIPDLASVCSLNRNARCFLAIEIEASGSRKHTMGGAINAAALGRVGVSTACSPAELKKLLKMRRYLLFLKGVGKNTFDTTNLLVVTREQLADALGVSLADVLTSASTRRRRAPLR
jgi:hypothetical protein